MTISSGGSRGKTIWYSNFRRAAYVSTLGSLIWTVLIILPFAPFRYLPPIIAGGGPGIWFLLGYLLYLVIGLAGFGSLSSFLFDIEIHERRYVDRNLMAIGFVLVIFGATITSILLAVVGALGGYALTINGESTVVAENLLQPFVYPITTTTVLAILGAALTILAMASAKVGKS